MSDTPEILEFVQLETATQESPWKSSDHLRRVLTTDEFSYLDPRPQFHYLATGGGGVLLRHEWERFKRVLAADRSRGRRRPILTEERHKLRLIRESVEGGGPGR